MRGEKCPTKIFFPVVIILVQQLKCSVFLCGSVSNIASDKLQHVVGYKYLNNSPFQPDYSLCIYYIRCCPNESSLQMFPHRKTTVQHTKNAKIYRNTKNLPDFLMRSMGAVGWLTTGFVCEYSSAP